MDPEYFFAPFGPLTVERRDPQFLLKNSCCWWSGQSWPYSTAQTLKALANLLHNYKQSAITRADYGSLQGGLELASSAHLRVADQTTYFALPEGQRGLFTGGGATIRVSGLVGKARMIDMILTGRIYKGQEAIDIGLAQYLVEGSSLDKALELARAAAANLPLTNFAIYSAISHIQNMSALDASYTEAMVAGMVNTQPEARARLEAFANKTAARTRPQG